MSWKLNSEIVDKQLQYIYPNGSNAEHAPILPEEEKPLSFKSALEPQKLQNDKENLTDTELKFNSPYDRLKIVYFVFILHGLGTLMPWNMFITAKEYFVDFKLDTGNAENSINYATNFLQYVGFASQIPNLVFNWLNIFVKFRGDLTKRIVYSLTVEIIIFIVTMVLAILNTSNWPGSFFWITMICVVLLNMANGIYQNTVYGMAARLPVKYTGAVVLGSNISGVFATIISIISSYIAKSQRTAAIYYFLTAMVILLLCFDTYLALPMNKFFRYHEIKGKESELTVDKFENRPPYWQIFKKAFPQLFNIFFTFFITLALFPAVHSGTYNIYVCQYFTFFITLALFPAVHSDIKRHNEDFFVPNSQFTAITCFLTFNLFAMLGSLTTSFLRQPKPEYLVIPVVLRTFFLPLFVFCNYQPKGVLRTLPVVISNEWIYWIIAIFMSFSSGYLSSLGMMYAPKTVPQQHQITAGMFAAAVLITGIFSGILFSMLMPWVVAILSF